MLRCRPARSAAVRRKRNLCGRPAGPCHASDGERGSFVTHFVLKFYALLRPGLRVCSLVAAEARASRLFRGPASPTCPRRFRCQSPGHGGALVALAAGAPATGVCGARVGGGQDGAAAPDAVGSPAPPPEADGAARAPGALAELPGHGADAVSERGAGVGAGWAGGQGRQPAAGPDSATLLCPARSLRQDSPEEWPVARLACSFEVSPEVVRRVLRSRFSPSPERGLKQDSRLSTSRAGAEALAPALAAQRKRVGSGAPPPGTSHPHKPGAELTARAQQQQQQQQPRLRVVQKGREFVDENGNLLYRIPA